MRSVFGIDPRALVSLRISLAGFLMLDLLLRARHLRALYSDVGVMPRALVDPFYREVFVGIHGLSGSTAWIALLFTVAFALALLMLVGRFTRFATFGSWVLLTSLQLRNPYAGDFGDEIFRLVLFWSVFLPLGRWASLDALRNPASEADDRKPVLSVATAGLLLQLIFVYFVGALLKTGPDWHRDATAIYFTLSQDWIVRPLGKWLLQYPGLLELTTRVVLIWEYVGSIALLAPWPRVRTAAVVGFVLFHLSLAATITLGLFPWLVCAVLTVFLPACCWDRLSGLPLSRRLAGRVRRTAEQIAGRRRCDDHEQRPESRRPLRIAGEVIAAVCFAWVLATNVANLVNARLPGPVERSGQWLRLDQKWNMYAPDVPRSDGWFVLPGRLADGSLIDLSVRGPDLSWDKPRLLSSTHRSWRWGLFMIRLRQPSWEPQRERYSAWACEQWNDEHKEAKRLEELQIYWIDERSPEAYRRPLPRRFLLTTATCGS